MSDSISTIPLANLALSFVPVAVVVAIMWKWEQGCRTALLAVLRMLVQLLLIGYFLAYIFQTDSAWIVLLVLAVMLVSSSWIALRTMEAPHRTLFSKAFCSIALGGVSVLLLMTQAVLELSPWCLPNYMIPLAGMAFANAMNSVSLAGERLQAEINNGNTGTKARNTAFQASLIPTINSLFAVGLVSLPGMMTGQILSGVSPLIAVRYQIMVMCMIFAASGIASATFLTLIRQDLSPQKNIAGKDGETHP